MSWQMVLAPFGVVFIVLLTWLWGGLKRPPTLDTNSAKNRFSLDYPENIAVSCDLSADADGALLELDHGLVGVVAPHGDCFTTRLLKQGDIADVRQQDDTVTIVTLDFKVPPVRIRLENTAIAARWNTSLAALMGSAA